MCGRYAASAGAEEVTEAFGVEADLTEGGLRPTWNAAPTQQRAVVVARPREAPDGGPEGGPDGGPEGAGAPEPRRELRLLTWGLVPSWSKTATGGAKMINARAETVLERPAYRRAAAARRCLVPADGWYEWQAREGQRKQPYFMSLAEGGQLALAGIYEWWRDGEDWLTTFAVLTRDAEPGLRAIHDRMPLVLPPQAWEEWLDPATTAPDQVGGQVAAACAVPPGRFTAVPVSARVGSVRQDDAALVEPVGPPLEV